MRTAVVLAAGLLGWVMMLGGCTGSPYQTEKQAKALDDAYANGSISANDYFARKNELMQIRSQQDAATMQYLGTMQEQQLQRQQLQQQQGPQPLNRLGGRSGHGTITGPGWETYQFNYQDN